MVTKHGTIRYVMYGFLLVYISNFVLMTRHFFQIYDFKKCRDLETRVEVAQGH